MARIRTIKPEFFTSEDIVNLTPLARLFYVSLWCEADREGRLKWQKMTLKMRYLPADNCSIDELSKELEEAGLVVPYEHDGKQYAHIPGFKHHQVINNREAESILPEPFIGAPFTRESGEKAEGKGKEGRERKGMEWKGREGEDDSHESPRTPKWTEEDREMAKVMLEAVQVIAPSEKGGKSWPDDIRKLRELDNHAHDEIWGMFKFANEHNFWQTNILSPAKLRKQWSRLEAERGKDRPRNAHSGFEKIDYGAGINEDGSF